MGIALGGGIFDLSINVANQRFAELRDAGVTWVRLDINWGAIEPTPGAYAWDETDALITAARNNGLQVLGLIAYTPSWARPAGSNDKHQPLQIEDFATFAGIAADRYRQQITNWEIWNEPNHLPFWSSGPDPVVYGQMLSATARRIREVQPGAFIISGGLSPAIDGSGSVSPETFISGFLPYVPPGLINAVGIHPYSFPAMPTDAHAWNTFYRMPAMVGLVQSTHPGVLLWPTEFGAPTNQVTPDDQAAAVRLAVDCSERHAWLGPMFIFTLQDFGGDSFGLLNSNASPKPAWATLVDLGRGGADPLRCNL